MLLARSSMHDNRMEITFFIHTYFLSTMKANSYLQNGKFCFAISYLDFNFSKIWQESINGQNIKFWKQSCQMQEWKRCKCDFKKRGLGSIVILNFLGGNLDGTYFLFGFQSYFQIFSTPFFKLSIFQFT